MQYYWLTGTIFLLMGLLVTLSIMVLKDRRNRKDLESLAGERSADYAKRQTLMQLVNQSAAILLESEPRDYAAAIVKSMEMICLNLEIDHLHLWQNHIKEDDGLYYKQVCKWIREGFTESFKLLEFSYQDTLPHWLESLSQGKCVKGPVSSFPQEERLHLTEQNIQSVLFVPIFLRNEFWGFASFDNRKKQREYSTAEEHLLRSWGLFAVSAVDRGSIAINMQYTFSKLEALIRNYKGIIWSADNNKIITTFNGQYLKTLGMEPSSLVGKSIEEAKLNDKPLNMDYIEKTFSEGPQDWISNINSSVFRSYTTPIQDYFGNISGIVGTMDDVTELYSLQDELRNAVEAAITASETKSRFLANMSHEMRTPLNAIIGLSELSLGSGNLTGESNENVERIYDSGMTLLGLINDILDISKIESGMLELVSAEYDTSSLINDTVSLNIVRIGSKPIQFRLHPDENLPAMLYGDELRIKQIFNNLLSNAFKYTKEGTVDWYISAVHDGEYVWLESRVEDSGIGIREEDIDKLFTDYGQVNTQSNRKIEGTGLGLSIAQKMAHLMDGEITVNSEYGKGTVFNLRIRQTYVGNECIGKDRAEKLADFNYTAHRRNRDKNLIRAWIPYARVLVVDDMPANLTVAQGILKPYGLIADCVTSGPEAIEAIRSQNIKYNAVFMDHMMPGMDGIEAVRIIREEIGSDYAKTIPIIALTANALIGNEKIFLQSGFQAFLTKPIDIIQMDAAINRWVRDKKLEKEMDSTLLENKVPETTDVIETSDLEDSEELMIEALIKAGEKVKGLDINDGLERLDWDVDIWKAVVSSFTKTTPDLFEILKNPGDENIEQYGITVHGIKSVCYSFGASKAGDAAKELEKRSIEKDLGFIKENKDNFVTMIEELLQGLNELLDAVSDKTEKPLKDRPDLQVLEKIFKAAENYDIRNLDEGITALENYSYQEEGELVTWLREQCNDLEFTVIHERLAKTLK